MKGLIYCIYDSQNKSMFYIGSTIQDLKTRISNHKSASKYFTHYKLYKYINMVGWDRMAYYIIDDCDIEKTSELRIIEGKYQNYYDPPLNKSRAGYFLDICKGSNSIRGKIYLGVKIVCECGKSISRRNMAKHKRTKKHKDVMNSIKGQIMEDKIDDNSQIKQE